MRVRLAALVAIAVLLSLNITCIKPSNQGPTITLTTSPSVAGCAYGLQTSAGTITGTTTTSQKSVALHYTGTGAGFVGATCPGYAPLNQPVTLTGQTMSVTIGPLVSLTPPPPATASMTCNGAVTCVVAYQATAMIAWTSKNATSCVVSAAEAGLTGSFTTAALTATTVYTVTCQAPAGAVSASTTVTVTAPPPPPPPTATITCNGSANCAIAYQATATIAWLSANATSCTVAPGGASGTSGSFTTAALTTSASYSVTCIASPTLSASASTSVTVAPAPPPSTSVLPLTPADITLDGYIRVPSAGLTNFAQGHVTGRLGPDGHPHLLLWKQWVTASTGPFTGVVEIDVSDVTPTPTLTTATPRAVLVADYGDISHGHVQSWADATCTPQIAGPGSVIPGGLFVIPGTNTLISSYMNSYVGSLPYNVLLTSIDPTTGASTFLTGPLRFQATRQYVPGPGQPVYSGVLPLPAGDNRATWFDVNPLDGTMLSGGIGYGDIAGSYGPNLYGGNAFPTATTPGGCGSAPVVVPKHFLDYYFPGYGQGTPNYYDNWTGESIDATTGQPTTMVAQMSFPASLFTYSFQKDLGNGAPRINPQLHSFGTDTNGTMAYVGWYEGAHTHGVIYVGGLQASDNGQTDPTACSGVSATPSAHYLYLNSGTGWMHFSSYTGTFNYGDTITATPSGFTGQIAMGSPPIAQHSGLDWQYAGTGALDAQVGDTVTSSSGGVGVIDEDHRRNTFYGGCPCRYGIDACATGPSSDWQTPVLVIYDPTSLLAVAADQATDYLQQPVAYLDLLAPPYALTDLHHNNPVQGGPQPAGGWIDAVNQKLYVVFHSNDQTTPGLSDDVIVRFSIHDDAPTVSVPPARGKGK